MNYYSILKEYFQVFHKLHPKYFQVELEKLSMLNFPLIEIEGSFPVRFVLFIDPEMLSIKKK